MPFTTIQVTGQHIEQFDGTPLDGFIIFNAGSTISFPDEDVVFAGSADATVTAGVMETITIPATDSTAPPFTYTVTMRLSGPDGSYDDQVVQGVAVPSTLGPVVDISQLI